MLLLLAATAYLHDESLLTSQASTSTGALLPHDDPSTTRSSSLSTTLAAHNPPPPSIDLPTTILNEISTLHPAYPTPTSPPLGREANPSLISVDSGPSGRPLGSSDHWQTLSTSLSAPLIPPLSPSPPFGLNAIALNDLTTLRPAYPTPISPTNGGEANISLMSVRTAASGKPLGSPDQWYIGVLLEIFGQLVNVLAKQIWRSIGKRFDTAPPAEKWAFTYVGVLGVLIYVISDVLALRFTSQSIVSACGGMAIVWNNLLAPFTLGETLTRARFVACVLIVTGTVGAALCGNHARAEGLPYYLHLLQQGPAVGYYFAISVFLSVLAYNLWQRRVVDPQPPVASKRSWSNLTLSADDRTAGFMFGAIAGSIAGNAFLTKVASTILSYEPDPFGNGYLYLFSILTIFIHTCALWMLYLGLRQYEALLLVTTLDAFNILIGALSGSFVLQEIYNIPVGDVCVFFLSVALILSGLILLIKSWPDWLRCLLGNESDDLPCVQSRVEDAKAEQP